VGSFPSGEPDSAGGICRGQNPVPFRSEQDARRLANLQTVTNHEDRMAARCWRLRFPRHDYPSCRPPRGRVRVWMLRMRCAVAKACTGCTLAPPLPGGVAMAGIVVTATPVRRGSSARERVTIGTPIPPTRAESSRVAESPRVADPRHAVGGGCAFSRNGARTAFIVNGVRGRRVGSPAWLRLLDEAARYRSRCNVVSSSMAASLNDLQEDARQRGKR
jgi:hypothetical protein